MSEPRTLIERINDYLSMGGLFNPELANHDAVRDLLIDCREALEEAQRDAADLAWLLERGTVIFRPDGKHSWHNDKSGQFYSSVSRQCAANKFPAIARAALKGKP